MSKKNKTHLALFCSLVFFTLTTISTATFAELNLPSGADRRPNLSVDPFERAREALRKLPSTESEPELEPAPVATPTPAPEPQIETITEEPIQNQPPIENASQHQNQPLAATTVVSANNRNNNKQAFTYQLGATIDALSITAGGDPDGDNKTGVLALVDLIGAYNTEAAGFWDNGLFYLYAAMIYGKGPSSADLHGVSTIDSRYGTSSFRVVEAWYEHKFPMSRSSALIGIHNFNNDFYVSEYAKLFVNAGFRMGQIILENAQPSIYPTPTFGTRFKSQLTEMTYFQTAIYATNPGPSAYDSIITANLPTVDEFFLATEIGMANKRPGESGYFKVGVGLWYKRQDTLGFLISGEEGTDSAEYILGDVPKAGNGGVYILAEMSIGEKLGIFFKHGRGQEKFNRYSQFYAAGLSYTGIIPGREKDALGLGLVHTRQSPAYLATFTDIFVAESAFEITYTTHITDWLTVQPDFQYIQQPSMGRQNPASESNIALLPNTMVIGLRVFATF